MIDNSLLSEYFKDDNIDRLLKKSNDRYLIARNKINFMMMMAYIRNPVQYAELDEQEKIILQKELDFWKISIGLKGTFDPAKERLPDPYSNLASFEDFE